MLHRQLRVQIAVAASIVIIPVAQAQTEEFTGATYPCEQYTASEAPDSSTKAHAKLSRLWVHGYLAGLYQATDKLRLSEAAEDSDLLRKAIDVQCSEFPDASLMAIAQKAIAPVKIAIPTEATAGLSIDRYTCAEHLDDKKGDDTNRAELADWWAFAFIQGYKNAKQPNMVIDLENEPLLVDAVVRNCAKNRDATYLELTALVAGAVKLK